MAAATFYYSHMTDVISAQHSLALDQIIDLCAQRNVYRLRASRAEDRIDRLLRYLGNEPLPDRLALQALLED